MLLSKLLSHAAVTPCRNALLFQPSITAYYHMLLSEASVTRCCHPVLLQDIHWCQTLLCHTPFIPCCPMLNLQAVIIIRFYTLLVQPAGTFSTITTCFQCHFHTLLSPLDLTLCCQALLSFQIHRTMLCNLAVTSLWRSDWYIVLPYTLLSHPSAVPSITFNTYCRILLSHTLNTYCCYTILWHPSDESYVIPSNYHWLLWRYYASAFTSTPIFFSSFQ